MARLTTAASVPDRHGGGSGGHPPRDNRDALVVVAVAGRIAPPRVHPETLRVDRDGRAFLLPGTGGVHPDVHLGDPAGRWLAEHLMVGASVEDSGSAPAEPGPLHLLACVGNRVRDAAGAPLGVVAGKRGGLAPGFMPPNLVSVEATTARLAELAPGSGVVIEAVGRGLVLPDWPDVELLNVSPAGLDALGLRVVGDGLEIPVRAVAASRAAGAGLGQSGWIGDLEITDVAFLSPPGIDLAFGDLVAFDAMDSRHGRYYHPGTVSVGIVAHGPSPAPGHGVGVTILLSGPSEQVRLVVDDRATMTPVLRALAEAADGMAEPASHATGSPRPAAVSPPPIASRRPRTARSRTARP